MLPSFSELHFFSNSWESRVVLDSWSGFRFQPDAYVRGGLDALSNGSSGLYIDVPTNRTSPSVEQISAYEYLREHEEAIHKLVLQHIFEDYPNAQEAYYGEEELALYMPNIERPEQLKTLIGLSNVLVLNTIKQNIGYIVFNFRSGWDPEHGFSVTLHKDRIVSKIGGPGEADFHARRDARGD
ncbi:MAG TPA: hypothetical protein VGB45_13435 [Abditibacterium sp.]|jgi:hypothetical protein